MTQCVVDFESCNGKKNMLLLLDKVLYLAKVVLDNDHLLSLDFEYDNGPLDYLKLS